MLYKGRGYFLLKKGGPFPPFFWSPVCWCNSG